jgi:hypothetical protein
MARQRGVPRLALLGHRRRRWRVVGLHPIVTFAAQPLYPDFLSYSVAVFLKWQSDTTLGEWQLALKPDTPATARGPFTLTLAGSAGGASHGP